MKQSFSRILRAAHRGTIFELLAIARPAGSAGERSQASSGGLAYLSVLSQISVTVLAILGASFAAYFVFLQERTAQVSDATAQEKINIASRLRDIRVAWRPVLVGKAANRDFEEAYRRRANVDGLQLIEKALDDLASGGSEFVKAAREIEPHFALDASSSRWLTSWALSRSIAAIAVQAPTRSGAPCTPQVFDFSRQSDLERIEDDWGCLPSSKALFPWSPLGPGFEEWRAAFYELLPRIDTVVTWAEGPVAGADLFSRGPLPMWPPSDNPLSPHYDDNGALGGGCGCTDFHGIAKPTPAELIALRQVYHLLLETRERVVNYDRSQSLLQNYSFSQKVHIVPIVLLLMVIAILGIFLPLTLIALNLDPSRTWQFVNLCIVIVAAGGAVLTFVIDAASPVPPSVNYLAERWLKSLDSSLKSDGLTLDGYALIGLDLYNDFLNDPDGKRAPMRVTDALHKYVLRAESYNAAVLALDSEASRIIRSRTAAAGVLKTPRPTDDLSESMDITTLLNSKGLADGEIQRLRYLGNPGFGVLIASYRGIIWIPSDLNGNPHASEVLGAAIDEARQTLAKDGLAERFAILHRDTDRFRSEALRSIENSL